ncbi:hypothetical protein [Nocardia sp. NPDC060259]|uniref:hypothetical protein n=1 Tax=Nocardia sp. NPDC060259 TaxID=3347088 RepID=UPI003660879E
MADEHLLSAPQQRPSWPSSKPLNHGSDIHATVRAAITPPPTSTRSCGSFSSI